MAKKVDAGSLADAIMKELRQYRELTNDEMEKIAKEVAAEGRKKLKAMSPRKTGGYASGWSVKATRSGNGKFSFTIYNKKKPSLTHLLEKGHQLRQGGRVRAFPHIKKVEDWCNEEYERRIKERLGQ